MAGNTIGTLFKLTSFGESHGPGIGGVIDGFPSGVSIDMDFINKELRRRRTGQNPYSSPRKETDELEIFSGIFEGVSSGTPIAFFVRNTDARPQDYDAMRDVYRPSHADFSYRKKYGIFDHRGGGRASARETLVRVAGGAFAKLFLNQQGISITAFTSAIGKISIPADFVVTNPESIELNSLRCPDKIIAAEMEKHLNIIRQAGDTVGSAVTCYVNGLPAGLGEPVFDKLEADLAKAILSINACTGFEYGWGFAGVGMLGSEHNDSYGISNLSENEEIKPLTNNSGGILAGISTGQQITLRAAFKPVPSLKQDQATTNIKGEKIILEGKGRHDVCIAPRAVPVVEGMTALIIADHLLRNRASKA
ncbi:MAG: chorismate synthase [Bacteroidota bacterium]